MHIATRRPVEILFPLTVEELELIRYALTVRLTQADCSVRPLLDRVNGALEAYESPTDV